MNAIENEDPFLCETEYINYSVPIIKDLVTKLTGHLISQREIACALFSYVRDEIKFGWTQYFSYMKASDVVLAGVGYSDTKSTLFVAMLRCARIPARQVFMDISCELLRGLGVQSGMYIDHSYTEIFLDGMWLKTDSYIVERPLFHKIREQLEKDNWQIGFGVHVHGTPDWDATGDGFAQFVNDGYFPKLTCNHWGNFRDTPTFYASVVNSHDNYDVFFPLTMLFFVSYYIPNSRLNALRS